MRTTNTTAVNRRRFLEALLGAALLPGNTLADPDDFESRDELINFLMDEGDQLGVKCPGTGSAFGPFSRSSGVTGGAGWNPVAAQSDLQILGEIINDIRDNRRFWWDDPDRVMPEWASLETSSDYSHLLTFEEAPPTFEFSASDLEFLAARNAFAPPSDNPRVLFGLRGCRIAPTDVTAAAPEMTPWGTAHRLETQLPNHIEARCVLGVWDRETARIRLFRGSTVPEVSHMFLYVFQIVGCNMLPTGQYRYRVGTHRPGSRNPQFGAFRQAEAVVVLRSPTDLVFRSSDLLEAWDRGTPADNIHAAHYYGRGVPPNYSSAGCQVILGSHRERNVGGPWAEFRKAAGLAATPHVRDDDRDFRYLLLTGLEAALASKRDSDFVDRYRRIRFGSSGADAAELQQGLGVNPDGDFRATSVLALIRRQKAQRKADTGIFTPTNS